ncbi:hypothetical protein NDU88_001759 [Pleurodeles waltl]|uniref:Uncharacterized protein n=1 Tax=Pleurodeles waltl TaxID=8319 RepID=A0AAV7M0G7_PLEWA|nr:hypothetical protein NDU88_001759 [Pleurodeles waltl]
MEWLSRPREPLTHVGSLPSLEPKARLLERRGWAASSTALKLERLSTGGRARGRALLYAKWKPAEGGQRVPVAFIRFLELTATQRLEKELKRTKWREAAGSEGEEQ